MNRSEIFPWIALVVIIVLLNLLAIYMGNELTGEVIKKPLGPFSVSELFEKAILNETVLVKGFVSEVLPEYRSKKGYKYQQFYLSDGEERIKVFCSEKYGKTDVQEGDLVLVEGKYQRYYREFEIYTYCSEIETIKG